MSSHRFKLHNTSAVCVAENDMQEKKKKKIQYFCVEKKKPKSSAGIFYSIYSKEILNVLFSHLAAVNMHEDSFFKFGQRRRKLDQIWQLVKMQTIINMTQG